MTATERRPLQGVLRWGGMPVPYVAAWSSEQAVHIARDKLIGFRPALFRDGARGEGKPLFGKMAEDRVRRVIVQRLCQVCTRPIRAVGYVCDIPQACTASGEPILREPPACLRCILVSFARCPGIARMREDPDCICAAVTHYAPLLVTVQPAVGGDPSLNVALAAHHGPPPVGYAKLALRAFTPWSPDA